MLPHPMRPGKKIKIIQKFQINKVEENSEKKTQKKSKRRSKSEVEGRTFECKLCNKSYLSYPALYTHYKLKHNTNNSYGRGRPKKSKMRMKLKKANTIQLI